MTNRAALIPVASASRPLLSTQSAGRTFQPLMKNRHLENPGQRFVCEGRESTGPQIVGGVNPLSIHIPAYIRDTLILGIHSSLDSLRRRAYSESDLPHPTVDSAAGTMFDEQSVAV